MSVQGAATVIDCEVRSYCDHYRVNCSNSKAGECVCESGFTGRKIRDTEEPYNDCGAVVEDEVVDGCPGLGLPEGEARCESLALFFSFPRHPPL